MANDPQQATASAREKLDCLLVHASKSRTFYRPLNVYQSCNRMAMGVLALADLADRAGYRTRILHVGIERALDRRFSFSDYLGRAAPRLVAFSLQFHHGIVDTIALIEEARRARPDAFIIVGGFTATFFARELMERTAALDAVCLGDSEKAFLAVLEVVGANGGGDLESVPNLVWRRRGELVSNEQSYIADEDVLNDLVFTRFDLMEHASMYVDMPKAFIRTNLPDAVTLKLNRLIGAERSGIFWGLPVGRGCVARCFYCGGGAQAQRHINKRRGVIFRTPDKVVETIRGLQSFGFKGSYVSFDPHPWSQDYYVELFRRMREERVRFNILFSAWGRPTPALLDAFAETVGPGSSFLISPETGCERLRKQARADSYTNAELLETLDHAEKVGVRTTVYFCIGVPGETEKEFAETVALKDEIEKRYEHASAEAFLIEVEPGSPWHQDPEKYGVRLLRRTLDDFIRDHSAPNYSSMAHLGYTSGFFGDPDIDPDEFSRRLLALRCRHFCNRRLACAVMSTGWRVARTLGLVPKPGGGVDSHDD